MEVVEEAEEMLAPKVAVSVLPAHTLFSPFSSLARRASVVCPLQHPVFAESRDDSNLLSFGNSLVGKREAKVSYLYTLPLLRLRQTNAIRTHHEGVTQEVRSGHHLHANKGVGLRIVLAQKIHLVCL